MASPGTTQDHIPLSQVLSISSSQLDELEMSPGYDINEEPLNFSENGQMGKSETELMTTGLQSHDCETVGETSLGLLESETITPGIAVQSDGSLHKKVSSSERDVSNWGNQATSRRKRPHPDSKC